MNLVDELHTAPSWMSAGSSAREWWNDIRSGTAAIVANADATSDAVPMDEFMSMADSLDAEVATQTALHVKDRRNAWKEWAAAAADASAGQGRQVTTCRFVSAQRILERQYSATDRPVCPESWPAEAGLDECAAGQKCSQIRLIAP